jgi:hypothetical protein
MTGSIVITSAALRWLYAPYGGGADVIAETGRQRDELRRQHRDWLSALAPGL